MYSFSRIHTYICVCVCVCVCVCTRAQKRERRERGGRRQGRSICSRLYIAQRATCRATRYLGHREKVTGSRFQPRCTDSGAALSSGRVAACEHVYMRARARARKCPQVQRDDVTRRVRPENARRQDAASKGESPVRERERERKHR
jgi:hypothetical protein